MVKGASQDPYGSFGSVPDSVRVDGSGANYSGVRASPNDFGAQIGAATQRLGATGEELAQHYGEMAVHTATNDAYVNGYAPAVNSLVSGYKQLSGMDAMEQLPEYQKQLKELNNQYINTGSPMQRELMGGLVARHTISTMDSMTNHADSQYVKHEATVNEQSVKNASDEAANNWQDPAIVDFNVNRAKGLSTLYYGSHVGHDEGSQPVVDQMAKAEGSKVVTSAINMALDSGDYKTANFYKNKYADVLSGRDKLTVEKSVSALNITDSARSFVDNILTGKPAVSPGTPQFQDTHVKANVAEIAQKEGFDPNIAFALHGTESDYGRGLKPTSARKDDFQTDVRLRDKGYEGDDLASSAHNGFKIWNTNSSDLTQRLGRPVSVSEGYLAYNQGGLGAATLLSAGPTETAVQALSKIMPPQDAIKHVLSNSGTATMAASDFSNHVQEMFQNHYDAQKVAVEGDVAGAIKNQSSLQLPAVQQSSNPHEFFNQINNRLPAAQAAVDAIPDDKVREAATKQLKLKYEQAKLGDTAWKNTQAQAAQDIAQDPRYTSMDEVPQTVKNNFQAAGQLKFLEAALTDKNNPKKDASYGEGFLSTLNRMSSDDATDKIGDLASLQQEYGERKDLHSSGFRQLASLVKNADTPEGKAKLASQAQFLNNLHQKMVAGAGDTEGKAAFEKALPLFFNAYGSAAAGKDDLENVMSLDPKNDKSFISKNGIKVPTPAEMTSKKIQSSVEFISSIFSGSNRGGPPEANPAAHPLALTPQEQVIIDFDAGKITEQQKNDQLTVMGVKLTPRVPRP